MNSPDPAAKIVRKLSGEEEMFRAFVESVTDYAIFALDAGGHVTTWNEGAAPLFGWNEEEIAGQHPSRFYPAADVEAGKPDAQGRVAVLGE